MHTPISNLHRQLLKRFNFSIGGYSNPEKEVSNFFYKLCKNELIYQNESIRLLMFGFAQLSVNNINEIDLDKWKTKPLSKFNYFDYSSGYAEVLLSLYIHCLNEICGNKRATNIISDNIRRDINLRVSIDGDGQNFHFRENKRLEALEIVVPRNIFNKDAEHLDINSFRDKRGGEIKNFVSRDEEFEHEYKIDVGAQNEYKNCYEELAAKVLKVKPRKFKESINSYLPCPAIQEKIKNNTLRNPKADLAEILAVAYSASLFCYFFDCSMEYFVSVSNVSGDKKYSLGSIAIGVKNGAELSFDERAMISIISNHIASNLSAQIIFNNNKEIKRQAFRTILKEKYNTLHEFNIQSDALHGRIQVEENELQKITELVKENESAFGKNFRTYIDDLKSRNSNHISKYCLVGLKQNEFCGCKIVDPVHVFLAKDENKPNCYPIGGMALINIPFVSNLFSRLTESQPETESQPATSCVVKGKRIESNQIIFDVEYLPGFPLNNFYSELRKSHNGDLIGTYFIENFSLLDAHGIFKIVDRDNRELFNTREMIIMIVENKIILNESHFVLDSTDLKNLRLVFVNELL